MGRRAATGPRPTSVRWATLVEQAREAVRAENLQPPGCFDVDDFTRRLGASREISIRLIPVDLGSTTQELCGLCVRQGNTALVYYTNAAGELARLHNIVHELGHLLFNHRSVGPLERPAIQRSLTASPQRATQWLTRNADPTYDAFAEAQADALGAALLGDAPRPAVHAWLATAAVRDAAARLEAAVS
ncbi:uncharacterized protein DUF955 [Pseudonocardia sediminis]|uniref:Uncharacterized protein DUF955 n=1 Tax=Pseudonocardia sediminis TaxID=1397368 RepID=A0A4Q7U7M9_PSEST|nr:ImmA/IrrE family metallo-endopeptidase [Pseudonocardia sediminis]RZT75487.1 uncharacterized protein DUF955 [Pseudonocardia sediminis]